MRTRTYRVSMDFNRGAESKLITTANAVSGKLYLVPQFPDPPVSKTDLDAAIEACVTAKASQKTGGTAATANKNDKWRELRDLMKDLALYVGQVAKNDLPLLLSSGFRSISTNNSRSQLPAPQIVVFHNGLTGQSLVTVRPVRNARGYGTQYALLDESETPGEWMEAPFATSSQKIPVPGLIPGRIYWFRVRAFGGITGQSDWSAVTSHRAY